MQPAIPRPLTNLQLELLKIFSRNISDETLLEIRQLLAEYFAKRAVEGANKVWDEQGWNDEKVDELLNTKLRARKS